MKIGRNDPCPCGSGRKYKKCCLTKEDKVSQKDSLSDDYISAGEIGDYGAPELDNRFFAERPFVDFSAQRLFYSHLLTPIADSFATQFVKRFISRGEEEEKRIREVSSIEALIEIMKQKPDPLNHRVLRDRILEQAEMAIPRLLVELQRPHNDAFAELAIRAIYESEIDCSADLLAMVRRFEGSAYTLSLLCILLGLIKYKEAIKLLWDCYRFFNEKYPGKNYEQGPLLALHDLCFEPEESSATVSQIEQGEEGTQAQVRKLLLAGRKIEAIKLVREKTNAGLKDAKDIVDSIEDVLKRERKS